MERDFYTDEFEELIKLKADQYRMYPSDKVWKGIHRSLHSNRKKYWFGFALLLTGLSYFGIDQLIVTPPAKQDTKPATETSPGDNAGEKQARVIPFEQVTPGSLSRNSTNAPAGSSRVLPPVADDQQPQAGPDNPLQMVDQQVILTPSVDVPAPILVQAEESNRYIADGSVATSATDERETTRRTSIIGLDQPVSSPSIQPSINQHQTSAKTANEAQKVNWLQEYAAYDLVPIRAQRINWQVSFAPTMNYRRLTGHNNANIQSSARNIPIALSIEGDLDRLVNHKPALGFELGSFLVYSLNHNLALKGGLQFNYTRYEIQAYSAATERATISLNTINGFSSSSISNFTQLRNFGGYAVQDLENQYFQLSVPLGFELNILGSNKLQLGVAGTVQPTYLLNRNTYLISSDYKNYTKEPSLLRKWNVHTSAETFVSYRTAGLKWQVGPQIRYQLLSSYTDKYPIKEYLIEYGVKIGVTKTIR